MMGLLAAALGGCNGKDSPSGSAATSGGLAISGNPAETAAIGVPYSFSPTVNAASGSTLTFDIVNKPTWAVFNSATGALTGTPTASDAGQVSQVEISVSDGGQTVALPAFSLAVGANATSVTLSWTIPTVNANGTPASGLAGYHIYYGTSAGSLNTVITVDNPGDTSQIIGNLSPGTWYFAIASFNTDKVDSALSGILPVPVAI